MVKRKNSLQDGKRRYAAHTQDKNEKLYEKTQNKKSIILEIIGSKLFGLD